MKHFLILSLFIIQACAFADSSITSTYSPAPENPISPLANIRSTSIMLHAKDIRSKQPHILGDKKNGFNMETANITITPTVDETIKNAFSKLLEARGHKTNGQDGSIDITVKKFEVIVDMGIVSVENRANIAIELRVKNSGGGIVKTLTFTSEIVDTNIVGNQAVHQRIVDEAISNLMDEVDNSSEFSDSLSAL